MALAQRRETGAVLVAVQSPQLGVGSGYV